LELGEAIAKEIWSLIDVDLSTPFPRMTYAEAMRRFGTDKPDLRFGQELVECTEFFADTPFRVFQADYVGAVVMPGGASQPRKRPCVCAGRRRWHARRAGGQEPVRI